MDKMNLLKGKKWVVAVSGGSDSMALLHKCLCAELEIVVAHVNYHKRESANRDMQGVLTFCKEKQVPCFVLEVDTYDKRNFQLQAREIRYRFFEKCVKENNCAGVLVAHHKDDLIETYLMQKKAGRIVDYYGIKEEVQLYNVHVIRCLLSYSKEELKEYCIRNEVPYYEDESNFSDAYERNRIRHLQVEKMSLQDKNAVLKEIKDENEKLKKQREKVDAYLCKYEQKIEVDSFLKLERDVQILVLRQFIVSQTKSLNLSFKNIKDMIRMIQCCTNDNKIHNINENYDLYVEYGKIFVGEKQKEESFSYTLEKIEYIENENFKVCKEGKKIEGIYVNENDFPLTIRNAQKQDEIALRFGTKKVNRFFIDRKIPHSERKKWPVVVNAQGKVIFVCGIGCDINHYSNTFSFFVIK